MCDQGDIKKIQFQPGSEKIIEVDECIAPIIWALNRTGIDTVASCCGHGQQPGSIALKDGREIRLMSTFEDARKVDKLFPAINPETEAWAIYEEIKKNIKDILDSYIQGISDPYITSEEIIAAILTSIIKED